MVPQITRRHALIAAGTGVASSLAGCTEEPGGSSESGGLPESDLIVKNRSGAECEYALTITKQEATELLFSDSVTLGDGEHKKYDDPMPEETNYDVRVVSGTLDGTFEYTSCDPDRFCYLHVIITADELRFLPEESAS